MNETHNGNLNRSVRSGPQAEEGVCDRVKSNDPEASLRKGSLPTASAVTTVDRDANKGKAIKCAENQNLSDGKTDVGNLAQVPVGTKRPTTTGSGN
jgi:hypothetical protein